MTGQPAAPISPRQIIPWGLVGMLALVGGVEATIARHGAAVATSWSVDWGHSRRAATREARGRPVLIFGDSQVRHGLAPKVIAARSGRSAYNLSVTAGQAASSYFLLRRAIEAGARPRAVVVDFKPYLLAIGPAEAEGRWPDLLDLRDTLDLAWTTRDARLGAAITAARWLPSLKHRPILRLAVGAALQGRGLGLHRDLQAQRRNLRRNDGALIAGPKAGFDGRFDPANPGLFPRTWAAHPANAAYLRRFLDLAARYRIAVYWLQAPYVPGVQERREALGLDAAYERLVAEALGRHPNLVVVDGRHAPYAPSVFIDPLHYNRLGAAALSADVADILRRPAPAGPPSARRVALPAFRERDAGGPLEDLEQSMLALDRGRARRR